MIVDDFPLSSLQQGLLYHDLSRPGEGVDIEQLVIDYHETVNAAALERAWQIEVARHPALRTSFHWAGVDEPRQQVHDQVSLPFDRVEAGSQEDFERFLASDRARGFDLTAPPLMRLTLFQSDPGRCRLVWTLHHILLDLRATVVVLDEVEDNYRRLQVGQPPDEEAGCSFRPYVEWERARDLTGAVDYWRSRLHGLEGPTPLPPDLLGGERGGNELVLTEMEEGPTAQLSGFCAANALTLPSVVMGAWGLLLSRYSGERSVVFGAVTSSRGSSAPGSHSAVGMYLNTHPVCLDAASEGSVVQWIHQVGDESAALGDYAFAPLSAARRAATQEGMPSLFDTLVIVDRATVPGALELLNSCWKSRRISRLERTGYPLALKVYGGRRLTVRLEFDHERYSRASAERILGHFVELLEAMTVNPQTPAGRLPFPGEHERRQLLDEWNRTEAAYPRDISLAAMVERQVAQTPGAVAVVAGDGTLTYHELNARANRLAHRLRAQGAAPDVVVGLCLERSTDLVVALLAIIKAGAAYLPLDPLLPADRLGFMLAESGTSVVVADASTRARLREFAGTVVMPSEPGAVPDQDASVAVTPDHLAYVIYTSGSTGWPKGVEIPRGAFTNFLWAMQSVVAMSNTDRLLAVTTISFDIAGLEIWLPLVTGAQIVLAGRETARDASAIEALLAKHDITIFQATPVTWRLLLAIGWAGKKMLRALCGGEALPPDLAKALRPTVGQLWNVYGPTETTVWSTCARVEDTDAAVLIGRPLANTRCYVLDAERRPVPVGAVGELYIGGDGLARGYLNRPDLTAEKFVRDPFDPRPRARMYRTGDLARYHPDGQLECLGRTDHQIKIHGFRVEPGEIEARLKQQAEVQDAVVVARDEGGRDKQLVAYLVARPGSQVEAAKLRGALRTELPDYMVPAFFVTLDKFPLTPSGKIDRRGLPSPQERAARDVATYKAPKNPVEFALEGIWAEVLNLPRPGIDANFFDLGGDSLLSVALMSRVLAMFPATRPALSQLLHAPTPAQFAKLVGRGGVPAQLMVKLRDGKPGRLPFFCIPGAGGNILSLRPLALAMPDDVPFYCLQAKGLDGSAPFDTVEDTARRYVEEIRSVQPRGPYRLGGGCYGGLVAYETACLLEAAGERVDVLALIDAINPAYGRSLGVFARARAVIRYYADQLRENVGERPSWVWRGFRKRVGRALNQFPGRHRPARSGRGLDEGDLPFVEGDAELTDILVRVRSASDEAARRFTPRTNRGPVLVIKAATQEPDIYSDPSMGWGRVVRGPLTVVEVPGDHESSFLEPHVRAVALAISAVLH